MSKSLRARLDRAYQLLASSDRCHTCGVSLDNWPVEIYVRCIDDPEDLVYLPNPPDYSRCPTCNAPSRIIFWESEDRGIPSEPNDIDNETTST